LDPRAGFFGRPPDQNGRNDPGDHAFVGPGVHPRIFYVHGVVLRLRPGQPSKTRTVSLIGVLAVASFAPMTGATRAEGFLDFIFGAPQQQATPQAPVNTSVQPPVRVAPPPLDREIVHRGSGSTGHSVAFCVRLCDGKSFPLERYPNATPVETCQAMCPASKTKVYFGTEVDGAVARDGARYANLDSAFLHRKQLVANCTCNGRDAFGLAPFAMASDPTLRPGDIVVTKDGLMAYTGKSGQAGGFTPVDPASISAELNSVTVPPRLTRRVEPVQPAQDESEPVAPSQSTATQSAAPQNAQPQYPPSVVDLRTQDDR
jgi:hypothetical protein